MYCSEEFMEESGANKVGEVLLNKAQRDLLDRVVSSWRVELGCTITNTTNIKTAVTWSKSAMEITEKRITELMRPIIINSPVPDNRTAQNAGYSTTVYEVLVDVTQSQLLALLLTLRGGDDAADFDFYRPAKVTMQSTHDKIFSHYLCW
jgi:hypothetical protein